MQICHTIRFDRITTHNYRILKFTECKQSSLRVQKDKQFLLFTLKSIEIRSVCAFNYLIIGSHYCWKRCHSGLKLLNGVRHLKAVCPYLKPRVKIINSYEKLSHFKI